MKKLALPLLALTQLLLPFSLPAANCDLATLETCCQPECRGSYFAYGEFLFWNATEENLDFAIFSTLAGSQPPFAPTTFPSSLSDGDRYSPGCRLALGYTRGWDFAAIWTHFYSKKKNSAGHQIPGFFLSDTSNPVAEGSDGEWIVNLNAFDLELSYPCAFSCFQLRPHVGARAAWVNQKIHVLYESVTFIGNAFPSADYFSLNKNDFWGIGLRGGADCFWCFWKDFALFAKSGLTLLTGRFNVSRKQILEDTVTFSSQTFLAGTTRAKGKRVHELLVSAIDLAGGLKWEYPGKSIDMAFSLAWEFQIWFSQNQMMAAESSFDLAMRHVDLKGDLATQGLTARVDLLF